jgi:glycosyltransferase involved in cell wall biosynthesis
MKKKLLITGKLPPPYMGPSVAFKILINSKLKDIYDLIPYNVQVNQTLDTLGKWSFGKVLSNIRLYTRFYTIIKKERPDLVLIPISQSTTGFVKDSIFILLCTISNIRVVLQLRGSNFRTWFNECTSPVKWYIKLILKKAEGVIVLGDKLRYLFSGLVPDNRIFVVPNGANISMPPRETNSDLIPEILYLANLQGSKGIEDVIEAISILNKNHPGTFTVKVAGAWRDEKVKRFCQNKVEKESLPVEFTGPVSGDKKFSILSNADIFVFTPREPEGHPWVIVEAMAASLPVVATDKGAISESISNGINGFIVHDRAPEQIADKLYQLIHDRELRTKMGKRNRDDYEAKYTESQMVNNFSYVFNSLMGSSNPE